MIKPNLLNRHQTDTPQYLHNKGISNIKVGTEVIFWTIELSMITRCLHCGNVTAADLVFDFKVGVRINKKGRKVGQASLAPPPPNPMTLPFDLPLCTVRGLTNFRNVKSLRVTTTEYQVYLGWVFFFFFFFFL